MFFGFSTRRHEKGPAGFDRAMVERIFFPPSGYPLSGCTPAEPDSVSPDKRILTLPDTFEKNGTPVERRARVQPGLTTLVCGSGSLSHFFLNSHMGYPIFGNARIEEWIHTEPIKTEQQKNSHQPLTANRFHRG